jgi:hypothetical protein
MKPLKPAFLCMAIAVIVISCHSSDHSPASADKKASPLEQRQLLIKELNRLKAGLASGDKNAVASFFSFPVPDSVLAIYAEDAAYKKDYEASGSQLTRSLFLNYYSFILRNLEGEDLNDLFRVLKTDSLLQKDTLEYEWSKDTIPCARFYSITIEDDRVTLMTRSDRNPRYKEKKEDAATYSTSEVEDLGDACEFASWLIFRFDGTRLTFIKLNQAG